MTEMQPFDLLHSPVEGNTLIEASAGTGKTYTIAALFLRLILEQHLSVDQILVVTFTQAATEELKHRIRSRLRDAITAFTSGTGDDLFLEGLLQKTENKQAALGLLRIALRDFDRAAVSTIHGFCLRMLHEHAFESGSLFDTELITDQERLKQAVVEDFWRKNFYNTSPLFAGHALGRRFSPQHLGGLLTQKLAKPYMKVIPEDPPPDTSGEENAYTAAFLAVKEAWASCRKEVSEILLSSPALHRGMYGTSKIPQWIDSMDGFLECGEHLPYLFTHFERFTSPGIRQATKKDHAPPSHPFFDLCENLLDRQGRLETVFDRVLLGIQTEFLARGEEALSLRKAKENIQSFDDLLIRLRRALRGTRGKALSRAIRERFKAALIDEFQDTDPIQYEIFKTVFTGEESILFLIGDPKQAIYGFRGADIFAYMNAAQEVEARSTLLANWRSDPGLVQAINMIFSNVPMPFIYEEIPFFCARAARETASAFSLRGKSDPPLQLWLLNADRMADTGKSVSKGRARDAIARCVAGEISRLLHLAGEGEAAIGDQPLRPQDIAVLVRTNKEAQRLQEALASLRVPSVLHSRANLFDSHEAMEMERVLASVHDPSDPTLLKAALATDMLGWNGEGLNGLIGDEEKWEDRFAASRDYHDLWRDRGFVRMFRHLLSKEKVMARLMAFPDGERRTTNLLHLGEVLHRVSAERDFAMTGLLKWLGEQRHPDTQRLEEHQLRLESDENAVRLVTIHKSKGLEYPVVFCPFMWEGSLYTLRQGPVLFHDGADNMKLTMDLGSEAIEPHTRLAERENLAENLRLLYVGLTRARCRCYLVWGRISGAGTSAPAYLFHPPAAPLSGHLLDDLKERFQNMDDRAVRSELETIRVRSTETIQVAMLPEMDGEVYTTTIKPATVLSCREFKGKIDRTWRITSFSSLVGRRHAPEAPDRDEAVEPGLEDREIADGAQEARGIFAFPRGAKAGTFLHDVLEHLDFTQDDDAVQTLVNQKLERHGFESHWVETIHNTIRNLLAAPLEHDGKPTLSAIDNESRLNELEFYFPLKRISPESLSRILETGFPSGSLRAFPSEIGRLRFDPSRGFMRGFVDMVFQWKGRFFLVDWKSNHLGNTKEAYEAAALEQTMLNEYYVLQYLIYTLAMDRYLSLRVPDYHYETHFGGVYYIFLRGIDPGLESDTGIYRDRPPSEQIRVLRKELLDVP